MSVRNFIPTIWEARLLANFHKTSVADSITTKPTVMQGEKIIFNNVSNVAIKDYVGKVVFDELDLTKVELNMDQKKYWAFKLDDVDKIQASGDLVDSHTAEAAANLQEKVDAYIFDTMAKGAAVKLGDKALDAKTQTAYDLIVDMNTELNKKKVPRTDRFTIINSEMLGLLCKDERFLDNPVVLENGIVEGQMINGSQIIVSDELPVATNKTSILSGHISGCGYGKEFDETEAIRLESAFADGIRGLCIYGATVLKPEALVTANVTIA